MSPIISIVVPWHSGTRNLDDFLSQFSMQECAELFEILIVVNPGPAPTPTSEILLPSFPHLRVFACNHVGVGRARNLGIEKALASWIYFLDADCRLVGTDHLRRLISFLGGANLNTLYGGEYQLPKTGATSRDLVYHAIQDRWYHSGVHQDFGWVHFLGGNLLVAAEFARQIRFDEEVEFGGSETEFVYRFLRAGGRGEKLEKLGVEHLPSNLSASSLAEKAFQQGWMAGKCRHVGTEIPSRSLSFRHRKFFTESPVDKALYDFSFVAGQCAYAAGTPQRSRLAVQRTFLSFHVRKLFTPLVRHFQRAKKFAALFDQWLAINSRP